MNDIVTTARTWTSTPYHHQARRKGVGVDCAGLVIGVARELHMVPPDFDITGYARQPDGVSFMAWCNAHMTPVTQADMAPGHAVVVHFGSHPQHIGIVGDYLHGGLSIIHALAGRGVVETRLLLSSNMKFVAAFALPEQLTEAAWRS